MPSLHARNPLLSTTAENGSRRLHGGFAPLWRAHQGTLWISDIDFDRPTPTRRSDALPANDRFRFAQRRQLNAPAIGEPKPPSALSEPFGDLHPGQQLRKLGEPGM